MKLGDLIEYHFCQKELSWLLKNNSGYCIHNWLAQLVTCSDGKAIVCPSCKVQGFFRCCVWHFSIS